MPPFLSADDQDPSGCAIGYATINVAALRCRAIPQLDGAIISTWLPGTRVIVWAQRQDGWWLIEAATGGRLGWSFAGPGYISIDAGAGT